MALASFAGQDYGTASVTLNSLRSSICNIGGSCVQRDIIEQTMIESYLRDGQYEIAKVLLCERYNSAFSFLLFMLVHHMLSLSKDVFESPRPSGLAQVGVGVWQTGAVGQG